MHVRKLGRFHPPSRFKVAPPSAASSSSHSSPSLISGPGPECISAVTSSFPHRFSLHFSIATRFASRKYLCFVDSSASLNSSGSGAIGSWSLYPAMMIFGCFVVVVVAVVVASVVAGFISSSSFLRVVVLRPKFETFPETRDERCDFAHFPKTIRNKRFSQRKRDAPFLSRRRERREKETSFLKKKTSKKKKKTSSS